jgi:L-aspartate oxidase
MRDPDITADILVIGSGIAGASAALEAAKSGLQVAVLTQSAKPEDSNTYHAQGGIVSLGPDDYPELLRTISSPPATASTIPRPSTFWSARGTTSSKKS